MLLHLLAMSLHLSPASIDFAQPPKTTIPLMTASVIDVRGVLQAVNTHVGQLADNVDLIQGIGSSLGDPELKGLPYGSNATIYMSAYNGTLAALEVSPDMLPNYAEAINRTGKKATVTSGLLTVRSSYPYPQPVAVDIERAFQDLQVSAPEPSITALFEVQDLLKRHKARIEPWIESLKKTALSRRYGSAVLSPEAQRVRQVLDQMAEVWFRVYLAILRRTDQIQIALTFPPDGVHAEVKFKAVESLSKIESEPTSNSLLAVLPPQGAIRGTIQTEPVQLKDSLSGIIPEISTQMKTSTEVPIAWLQLIDQWAKVSDGFVALNMVDPEHPGFNASFAFGIKDQHMFLELLRTIPGALNDAGLISLYEQAGVKLTVAFEEARRIYNGVTIHRLVYKMDITNREQLHLGAMELTNLSADIFMVGNRAIVAMGSTSINKLVDRVLAGHSGDNSDTLTAEALGPGGRFYMDYDLMEAYSTIGKVLPPSESNSFKALPISNDTSTPLRIGGYREEDGYRVSVLFPTDLMVALKNGFAAKAKPAGSSSSNSHSTPIPDYKGSIR